MDKQAFDQKLANLFAEHKQLISRANPPTPSSNGVYQRYQNPIVTAEHTPIFWRYDLNHESNPFLMERMGINAAFNAGAIEWQDKILLIVRVEGADRKSFFGIAESSNGIEQFKFWDEPIHLPENENPDVNAYDMRLTQHEDGWIYGLYCTERKDSNAPTSDTSAAEAQCGIVRTKNLLDWERLPDLKTPSQQQRNVVLHPEFVGGKYALYTRPQDGFINTGSGGGIGWGLTDSMENAHVAQEYVLDPKLYHTIKEVKVGQGPPPIKTPQGWLHLAHGVRNTAAGLRYVLYLFMTSLENPTQVIHQPGGYFMAPEGEERIGDVSNVLFANGWVARANGQVLIYYASSDTRMHVATSSIEQLVDYTMKTPEDPLFTGLCVAQRKELIHRNKEILNALELSI